jgi:ABC-type glycerol-3-phosphate transport system substrate-binding protein
VTKAPQFTAYSGFPLPKGEGATLEPRTWGGTGKNGVVNAKGKQVEESLKFVKWLTEKEQEATFMEMVPLIPTNPAAVDPTKISPQLSMFAGLADKIQKVYSPMSAPVVEAFVKGVQSILLKEKSIEQVLDDADLAQKG